MSQWLTVLAVGAGSYAFRLLPLLIVGRLDLSQPAQQLIGRAGLAAITALIATSLHSTARGTATWPSLTAVAIGAALAARGTSMLRIVAIGSAMYAAVRLGGGLW